MCLLWAFITGHCFLDVSSLWSLSRGCVVDPWGIYLVVFVLRALSFLKKPRNV